MTIFQYMIHKEIEVYVDDVIIKSRESLDHLTHLNKFFDHFASLQLEVKSRQMSFWSSSYKVVRFFCQQKGY